MRPDLGRVVLAIVAGLAVVLALWHLVAATAGVAITRTSVGKTPVTIFASPSAKRAPVVVIAHGFAGSQQLMQSFALALARNGYVAVTFDFFGHGRNPNPLKGSITDANGATKVLVDQLAEISAFARRLPQSDGRVAVLGHSMASDIVVRYAQSNADVAATVTVSMFAPGVTATSPRNLLVVVGAWEPQALKDEALRVVARSLAQGTARQVVVSPHVEHVSVLYARASLAAALDWLDAAFGRADAEPSGLDDARGLWIMLLLLGLTLLAPDSCRKWRARRLAAGFLGIDCCRSPWRRRCSRR